jgi:hypothetical protein
MVVIVEDLSAVENNPLKEQLETRYALPETRLQHTEDAKRETFDFI